MTGEAALIIILIYFGVLIGISYLTSRNSTNQSFFTGDRQSPWFLVAFGMIGATLSGITFISVPGQVFGNGMSYMPMVIGFFLGYFVVSYVLIPIYYKLNLTSIYSYLKERFGVAAFKTGAISFLISRIIGASLRLFLVAEVLEIFLFEPMGIPYWAGVLITILLIWVYTFKSGIKTIVWTDTLQTAALLIAAGATIYFLANINDLGISDIWTKVTDSKMYSYEGGALKSGNVWLGLFNGIVFTIAMSGLDQDIMQKNLTCKNKKEAQKNITWFSLVLVPINLIFLVLGILMFETYIETGDLTAKVIYKVDEVGKFVLDELGDKVPDKGEYMLKEVGELVKLETSDHIYPSLAKNGYFPFWLSATFLIGLIAAAYSSADSALTSLTTSFCLDIVEKDDNKTRIRVHIMMSLILFGVVMIFKVLEGGSIVWKLFTWTGYTYGPLLGLYGIGILTKIKVYDKAIPFIAIASALSSLILAEFTPLSAIILPVNGVITAIGLFVFQEKKGYVE